MKRVFLVLLILFPVMGFSQECVAHWAKPEKTGQDHYLQQDIEEATKLTSEADQIITWKQDKQRFNVALYKISVAINKYERIVNDPNSHVSKDVLNQLYLIEYYGNMGVGKYQEAIEDINKCLNNNPGKDQGFYYYLRGKCKLSFGDKDGACIEFHRSYDLDYLESKNKININCN